MSEDEMAPVKRKKPIPKVLKDLCWNRWIGDNIAKHVCLCCEINEIKMNSFHCGHILAESNGGATSVENMKPICAACNLSMGQTNLNDFRKRCGFGNNAVQKKKAIVVKPKVKKPAAAKEAKPKEAKPKEAKSKEVKPKEVKEIKEVKPKEVKPKEVNPKEVKEIKEVKPKEVKEIKEVKPKEEKTKEVKEVKPKKEKTKEVKPKKRINKKKAEENLKKKLAKLLLDRILLM